MTRSLTLELQKMFLTQSFCSFVLKITRPLPLFNYPVSQGGSGREGWFSWGLVSYPLQLLLMDYFHFILTVHFKEYRDIINCRHSMSDFHPLAKYRICQWIKMLLLGWLLTPEDHNWWKEGGSGHIASCYSINEQWICIWMRLVRTPPHKYNLYFCIP